MSESRAAALRSLLFASSAAGMLVAAPAIAADVTAEDGVVVDLVDGKASIVGQVPAAHVYVDGGNVGTSDEDLLKERRILRDEGFVSIVVVRDADTGKIISGPDIHARGVSEGEKILQRAVPKVEQALEEARLKGTTDVHQLQQVVRRAVGGWVGGKIRRGETAEFALSLQAAPGRTPPRTPPPTRSSPATSGGSAVSCGTASCPR